MKVLICDSVAQEGIDKMKKAGFTVDVKTGMKPEELNAVVGDYEVVVVRSATKIRKPTIDVAKKLKMVIRGGVGIDNIDADYAKQKGIEVRNTPGASSVSVAELAIGMMYSLARHIAVANASTQAGQWEKKKFEGIELTGKTIGVVGFGRIGRELAKRCKGVGMKVLAYDIIDISSAARELGAEVGNFDDVLKKSDFISIHIPAKPDGSPAIGKNELAKMKKTAFLINCARGGVVDEQALADAVKSGALAGAGVDVFTAEPMTADNPLRGIERIILTPHLGASSEEGQFRVSGEVADIVISAFK